MTTEYIKTKGDELIERTFTDTVFTLDSLLGNLQFLQIRQEELDAEIKIVEARITAFEEFKIKWVAHIQQNQ